MNNILTIMAFLLIFGAVIVDSQKGDTFYAYGIEWKQSHLSNWMFWSSFIWFIIAIATNLESYRREQAKRDKDEFVDRSYPPR